MSESQSIEYKSSWRDEYLKWICGFANAQGGKLYIGVDDNGKVCGVSNIKRLLEDIPNKIQTSLGIVTEVNKKEKDGLEYIEIIVVPSSFPVSYRGEFHYRSGATEYSGQKKPLVRNGGNCNTDFKETILIVLFFAQFRMLGPRGILNHVRASHSQTSIFKGGIYMRMRDAGLIQPKANHKM